MFRACAMKDACPAFRPMSTQAPELQLMLLAEGWTMRCPTGIPRVTVIGPPTTSRVMFVSFMVLMLRLLRAPLAALRC